MPLIWVCRTDQLAGLRRGQLLSGLSLSLVDKGCEVVARSCGVGDLQSRDYELQLCYQAVLNPYLQTEAAYKGYEIGDLAR